MIKLSKVGVVLLLTVSAATAGAPWIAAYDPGEIDPLIRLQGSSVRHWMGTDSLGRDVLSRTLWGGRASMIVGGSVAVLATVLGVLTGLAAGFVRTVDGWVMRAMDGLMAIPGVLLAIALTAFMQPSLTAVIIAITVPEVPKLARLVRSMALQLREMPFVKAAHAIGAPLPRIIVRHVLPHMAGPLLVQGTFIAAWAVLVEATLSFLGVGLPAQMPSWGGMMAEGRSVLTVAPHIVLWPGLLVAATVFAINLLGDGLRDALDPHLPRDSAHR
jgi:peptide/nickel transport system permease protein